MEQITTTTDNIVITKTYDFEFDEMQASFDGYEEGRAFDTAEIDLVAKEDACSISDKISADIAKLLTEPLNLAECYWDYFLAHLNVAENIKVGEVLGKHTTKPHKDGFKIRDKKLGWDIIHVPHETIKTDDELKRTFTVFREYAESITMEELLKNAPNIAYKESFNVTDTYFNAPQINASESISVDEKYTRECIIKRKISESVGIAERLYKDVTRPLYESFNMYDTYIRASHGVMSHIAVQEKFITLSEFNDLANKPSGYTAFAEFKVGEYEYQNALVRIKFNTKVQQTKPSATNVVMHVDIPDTDDRGTVQITDTSAATKVYFNKMYYTPPEVAVTLRGFNTGDGMCTPNIVSVYEEDAIGHYFEVELLNSGGARCKGSISWVAKGY